MTNETEILSVVLSAGSLTDLAGSEGKSSEQVFRLYARKVHPDMFQNEEDKAEAEKAFKHLAELKDRREDPEASVPSTFGYRPKKHVLKTDRNEYELQRLFQKTWMFSKYTATYDNGHKKALVYVLNAPEDMDLFEEHVSSVRALDEVPPHNRLSFPACIEEYRWEEDGSAKAMASIHMPPGFSSLGGLDRANPNGLESWEVIPLFRQMLVAVGEAHTLGIVNGAPTLDAFIGYNSGAGLILTDWGYSVPINTPLRDIVPAHRHLYPDYALAGEPVDDRLDLHIIAGVAESLLGPHQSKELFGFFRACKEYDVRAYPELLAEFDMLTKSLYRVPKKTGIFGFGRMD